ncbi:MAG: 3-isopropylmalate dehydratase large subunit [Jatrophihabitans sp.]
MTHAGRNLIDAVWDSHVVHFEPGEPDLLFVDLHLLHEASSPQAFEGLRIAGRPVRRPDLSLAIEDHNVPTDTLQLLDPLGRAQIETLRANCAEFGIENLQMGDANQGIVHVVAPELGLIQPGMVVICGDSHTSTLGAFGALAFGVGTSDVEHVLATQTIAVERPRTMSVDFLGTAPTDVTAKDLALALVAQLGANGAHGHIVEYRGEVVRGLSMEGRMTLCNMTIESGARAGMIAPDLTTFDYLAGRKFAPGSTDFGHAIERWSSLASDPAASYDRSVRVDVSALAPFVTWGTNPGQAVPLTGRVPDPDSFDSEPQRVAARRALEYMALVPNTEMQSLDVDMVFLGSCTNGRIEDLRAAASVLRNRRVADGVTMLVVPGSMDVRAQAEREGLDEIFRRAGAQWRLSGCSMCMGINPDRAQGSPRIASTSNRNYEGRQGTRARTHLVSPAVAAATAVAGRLQSPRLLEQGD